MSNKHLRSPTIIVLYDHACPLCRTEMMKIKARDQGPSGKRALKLIDISAANFDAHAYGFAPEALSEALHVRDRAGYWHIGMDAIRLVYREVGLGWAFAATGWPGLRSLFDKAYVSLARNRVTVSSFLINRLGMNLIGANSCNDDRCALHDNQRPDDAKLAIDVERAGTSS